MDGLPKKVLYQARQSSIPTFVNPLSRHPVGAKLSEKERNLRYLFVLTLGSRLRIRLMNL